MLVGVCISACMLVYVFTEYKIHSILNVEMMSASVVQKQIHIGELTARILSVAVAYKYSSTAGGTAKISIHPF